MSLLPPISLILSIISNPALAEGGNIPVPLSPMPNLMGPDLPLNPRDLPTPLAGDGASGPRGGSGGSGDSGGSGSGSGDSSDDSSGNASGQSNGNGDSSNSNVEVASNPNNQASIVGSQQVTIDFVDTPLIDIVKFMAKITGKNFILTNDLKGSVTIISHQPVTVPEAYEAFLSALEANGYTTVTIGTTTKIVSTSGASNAPLRVNQGGSIPYTENFVTQIIQLENVAVSEISSVVKDLSGKDAKIIAYAPSNTLIITDSAVNIRRVYKIITQMDVASPKSKLRIIPLEHATAGEIVTVIKEIYGSAADTSSGSKSSGHRTTAASKRSSRSSSISAAKSSGGAATNVGKEGSYIEKIISDERTNSIIMMANEEALEDVARLIGDLDVDVDPASRAQIHVIYLEHAKAEDVSQVLSNLSESTGRSSSRTNSRSNRSSGRASSAKSSGASNTKSDSSDSSSSAVAAFDSGVRITSDENTNSLVIIATPDQIRYIKQVIDKLDILRKQVFIEAVILELASDESYEFGLGAHLGKPNDDGSLSIFSTQLNQSSLGLSADLLSGMAMGVFGEPVSVSVSDGSGGTADMSVPAFGIALNALQSNSAVNILSTPNIMTMNNEEASIVVGRNIPFPVSTGRDNNNNPIVSYQREDVATTLKVTPQVNESNYVTLTVFQEVQEVEEDSQGLDVSTAGFITSKRSADTTVVVKDNQTIVIGGLIGSTETEVETKIPILGDIPVLGRLFRGKRVSQRKSNMLIFLTPHVIDDSGDLEEVYKVKVAQRQEFIRRFYGKSRDQQEEAISDLLQYSMNIVDRPSQYRGNSTSESNWEVIGSDAPANETSADTNIVDIHADRLQTPPEDDGSSSTETDSSGSQDTSENKDEAEESAPSESSESLDSTDNSEE